MKAILNHQTIEREKIALSTQNRGFTYGDGFFETIAIISGTPRFLDLHLARLRKAASLMQMETTNLLDDNLVSNEVKELLQLNGLTINAKLKIYLWRESSGLYAPFGGDSSVLLTVDSWIPKAHSVALKAGFSRNAINFPTLYSPFKTMSALKYVIAGLEKDDRELDEIIILDHHGNVSETLYSNIFWKQRGTYFTPPTSTGCIDGIMRNWLMKELTRRGMDVQESLVNKENLMLAERVFSTNSSGIRHIRQIEEIKFEADELIEDLVRSIS